MENYLYLSLDIETLGSIPGIHPMIQLGVVLYDIKNDRELSHFSICIQNDNYTVDEDTLKWWNDTNEKKQILDHITKNSVHPKDAMEKFLSWYNSLNLKYPQWVAYPSVFDYPFLKYYLYKYCDYKLNYYCDCLCSYIKGMSKDMFKTRKEYFEFSKKIMDKDEKYAHDALYDARKQAECFGKIRKFKI